MFSHDIVRTAGAGSYVVIRTAGCPHSMRSYRSPRSLGRMRVPSARVVSFSHPPTSFKFCLFKAFPPMEARFRDWFFYIMARYHNP